MLREEIEKYKIKEIAQRLNVTRRTLYNWLNDIHVENFMKYIELLEILHIDPFIHLKEYKQHRS